ncbi:unnamed protein product, partial [Discosporangium mesarthrocarpum]
SRRADCQSAVARAASGVLVELLSHLAFSRANPYCSVDPRCRVVAMQVVGAVVDNHEGNRGLLSELLVQDVGEGSMLLTTLVVEGALTKERDGGLNGLCHR